MRVVRGSLAEAVPFWELSSTLLPFLLYGSLIKAEEREKGYPYYYGVTQEPSLFGS